MMELSEVIKKRRSVRDYLGRIVEDEKLSEVLEAGRLAPSASNRQEWRYIVVKEESTRKKIAEAANNQTFIAKAPVVIVCCADTDGHTMKCGQKCYPIDCAISIDHMTLRAVDLGLATCWIGAFSADKIKKILNIPENIVVFEILSLGYPAKSGAPTPRKSLKEIIHYEKW